MPNSRTEIVQFNISKIYDKFLIRFTRIKILITVWHSIYPEIYSKFMIDYSDFYDRNNKVLFYSGELVPRFLFDNFLREINSYPEFYDEIDSFLFRRTRTQILMITTSPGELVPGYGFSMRTRILFSGFEFS